MSLDQCLGILLPEDGPTDYEWYALSPAGASAAGDLPRIEVGKIPSDGHHEPAALTALGAVDRLSPVGEALVRRSGAQSVVWACTRGSFIGGLAWARAHAGRVVLTANQVSLWAGLKRLQWSRFPERYLQGLASL